MKDILLIVFGSIFLISLVKIACSLNSIYWVLSKIERQAESIESGLVGQRRKEDHDQMRKDMEREFERRTLAKYNEGYNQGLGQNVSAVLKKPKKKADIGWDIKS